MSTQPVPANVTPAWDSILEQVHCPLCGYDLRGLVNPQCPECGYTFDWPDILDPARRLHPYLFEHHPEKNIRSFWRTLAGAMAPKRFWHSLQPVQPSRPRRLLLYWVVTSLTCILLLHATFLCLAGVLICRHLKENPRERVCITSPGYQYYTFDSELGINGEIVDPVLKLKYADKYYPDHVNWRLLRIVADELATVWPRTQLLLLSVFWPWVTFGSLMIFQWSMRRARIHPIHVLRCCIYSTGTLVWIGAAGVVVLAGPAVSGPIGIGPAALGLSHVMEMLSRLSMAAIGILVVVMFYQIITGCRLYLRFSHPVLIVVLGQVVAVLALLTVFSVGYALLYGYGPLALR